MIRRNEIFTNEFELTETITTVLDDKGQYEDIQIFIDESEVFIRQWNEAGNRHELIAMSGAMFNEITIALEQEEGMFKIEE